MANNQIEIQLRLSFAGFLIKIKNCKSIKLDSDLGLQYVVCVDTVKFDSSNYFPYQIFLKKRLKTITRLQNIHVRTFSYVLGALGTGDPLEYRRKHGNIWASFAKQYVKE